jgi:hypothetical protein
MNRQPPIVIHLPQMSDDSVVQIHRCLIAVIDAFQSRYGLQLWRYYEQLPEHERTVSFNDAPF